ncbi:hypothetical protein OH77DRAFT_1433746 [Trametes cingulata]|nr:hypothetical protein OH77DRAFT_1433746 [Trametes cingulata]
MGSGNRSTYTRQDPRTPGSGAAPAKVGSRLLVAAPTIFIQFYRHKEQDYAFANYAYSLFRELRNRAPVDTKERLILPCSVLRERPHEVLGTVTKNQLVVPTPVRETADIGTAGYKLMVYNQDVDCLDSFIDACNSLIEDEELRKEVGLTRRHFVFMLIPLRALRTPPFNEEEVEVKTPVSPTIPPHSFATRQELLENRSMVRRYGITLSRLLRSSVTLEDYARLDEAFRRARQRIATGDSGR